MLNISNKYAVQMRDIYKSFGNYNVLNGVNLDVKKGTIHSILGENGAGKSTLMNILYGLYKADTGEIYLNGELVNIKSPNNAIKNGIGMVHQHFMLIDKFTVTQNITLGNEITNKFGIIDNNAERKKVIELSEKYNLKINPDEKVRNITVGMQQRVEILKALYRGADLLILDEPTAVLTPLEVSELISIMKNLASNGKTIIIITHKLKEIKKSSEECTIIRRGNFIDKIIVSQETEETLAEKMIGRKIQLTVDKSNIIPGDVVFQIKDLCVKNARGLECIKNLSLEVKKGQIFGLAGIEGNGQAELVDAIIGISRVDSGFIKMNGKEIQNTGVRNVLDSNIAFIHEDRHKHSCILDFSVVDNAVLDKYRKSTFCKNGFLNRSAMDKFTKLLINKYDIRPTKCKNKRIRHLSGGNQQKLVIGREISDNPDLLIAVQPTRGLDIGAIEYVHKTLVDIRNQGKAILLISLELDEIMSLSDVIGVIYDGKIVDTFRQDAVNEKKLGFLMAGGKNNE